MIGNGLQHRQITVGQFMSKHKTKKEIYVFLTVDA